MDKTKLDKDNKDKSTSADKIITKKPGKVKKKIKKNITTGIAFVNATFNNTIISITDDQIFLENLFEIYPILNSETSSLNA